MHCKCFFVILWQLLSFSFLSEDGIGWGREWTHRSKSLECERKCILTQGVLRTQPSRLKQDVCKTNYTVQGSDSVFCHLTSAPLVLFP